jgi:hypothetical protein
MLSLEEMDPKLHWRHVVGMVELLNLQQGLNAPGLVDSIFQPEKLLQLRWSGCGEVAGQKDHGVILPRLRIGQSGTRFLARTEATQNLQGGLIQDSGIGGERFDEKLAGRVVCSRRRIVTSRWV